MGGMYYLLITTARYAIEGIITIFYDDCFIISLFMLSFGNELTFRSLIYLIFEH